MFAPRLGVSFHGIASEVTPEALAAVAASQIATLEIWASFFRAGRERPLAAFKGLFASSAVRAVSVHCAFGPEYDLSSLDAATHARALDAVRDAIDVAATLGARIVVLHASSEPMADPERDARKQQTLALLSHITPELRSAGLVGALELLPRTCLCHSPEELTWFLDQLDPALFGVCLDVNHAMARYAALPDMVRALGPRLLTTHLSDYDGVDEKHWLPGRGVIDWGALLRALIEIDYQGPFNYECPGDGQTAAERVRSYELNFRWLGGELLSSVRRG